MEQKTHYHIEKWTHSNILSDLLKEGEKVRSGGKFGEEFQIIYYKSQTIDLIYSRGSRLLKLRIFGGRDGSKQLLNLLNQRIEDYNEEYCEPKGL